MLLIPIVNIFIYASMCIDMVQSFRKYSFWDSVLSVLYAPVLFFQIGTDDKISYDGPNVPKERAFRQELHEARKTNDKRVLTKLAQSSFHKGPIREWTESIVFAVFAAAFIRMFLIEAYVIPTPSMEGSLKVGDYLFVSKAHYGMRTPMTILQIPLLHNRIPFFDRESYLKSPSLPYFRFPALDNIQRFDPVVFNYPEGDSVYVNPDRSYSYMDIQRLGPEYVQNFSKNPLTVRPIDKKDHYIKRCIGLPGDSLQVINKQVFINGKAIENPSHAEFTYHIQSASPINQAKLAEWGVNLSDANPQNGFYTLTSEQLQKVKSLSADVKVEPFEPQTPNTLYLFPHDPTITKGWTVDNYGPVHIPKAGETVEINMGNIAFYNRVIGVYEGNTLSNQDGKIIINGKEATTYTFKQDYYWMMGDNRHNSEDSRIWGFVPFDHVVGKPLFIWFSTKDGNMRNGINWDRIFTGARKM